MSERPTAEELLHREDALLTSSHLTELGLSRRAQDAVFRGCPTVLIPGYGRPMVRAADYLAFIESATYRGDRVWPSTR